MTELGRVDIYTDTSMISSHLELPRRGHLESLFNMFSYLKNHQNSEMMFDTTDTDVDTDDFQSEEWGLSIYVDVKEKTLTIISFSESGTGNIPESRGQGFTMTIYVDCDIDSDCVTRRSRTGFAIFLNGSPVYLRSEKQHSCEVSTFRSEFTSMKKDVEYVCGLRYKLRMMGIPCEDPDFVYGDNKSVLVNTAVIDCTLKKKMNRFSYHIVREGCEQDEWRTEYVNTNFNLADLLTKPLPSGKKQWGFVRRFYTGFNSNKVFVESVLGQVLDTTPCIWFQGFQICYWVKCFPG